MIWMMTMTPMLMSKSGFAQIVGITSETKKKAALKEKTSKSTAFCC